MYHTKILPLPEVGEHAASDGTFTFWRLVENDPDLC